MRAARSPGFAPVKIKSKSGFRYDGQGGRMTSDEKKALYIGKSVKFKNVEIKLLAHGSPDKSILQREFVMNNRRIKWNRN